MNPTIELLKSHRSIRKFSDRPIAADDLEQLILAGQAAATSSFVQTTSLIRVTDPAKRERLVTLTGNQTYVASCAEFFVFCADLQRNLSITNNQGLDSQSGFTEHFVIAAVDTSLFAQNMVVAAESMGLGICYIGGIRNHPAEVSELLGLPEQVAPLFGLCLGYPEQDPEVKPRLPSSMIVHENTYQTALDEATLERYDETVKHYYQTRTGGQKQQGWSEQIGGFFTKESRPHMLQFLKDKGFLQR